MNFIKHILKRIKEGMLKKMWLETKWIYGYARQYWKQIIIYTLIGLGGTVLGFTASIISKDLVDIITGHQTGALLTTFCLMIGFNIGNLIVNQLSNYISSWISIRVNNEIKADIFEKILITKWEPLTQYHTGDLLTRWSTDASSIADGVLNWIPNLIINIFKFIAAFAIVIYHDATFAIFASIGMPVSLIMSRTLMRRLVNNNERSAAMNAKMSGFNQEAFSNIQTIKAFDMIKLYGKRLRDLQHEYLNMKMDFQKMSVMTSFIMTIIGFIVTYSSYGWGIYRVWSGAISYGTMTLFLSLSSQLSATLNTLVGLVPTAISLTTSAGRLMDILDMPRENYQASDSVSELYNKYYSDGISLVIDHIKYSYMNGSTVFENASIEAHPHEVVGLVGPSGKGKTTMLRLILALADVCEGEAYIYGGSDTASRIDISPSTRKLFSYVPQGNTMFSGTIAENMRNVKQDATYEEIIQALKLSCAWEFVQHLPLGINSMIKERGGGFSEGQAQRLSIARALLRKSPILLLDEATSALDVATERMVLKNIMSDNYPRTCIVTTHRPTVLNLCKRVYSIDNKQCIILDEKDIETMINNF